MQCLQTSEAISQRNPSALPPARRPGSPDWAAAERRGAAVGSEARGSTPAEFTAFLAEETAKWTDVMKKANFKVQQ